MFVFIGRSSEDADPASVTTILEFEGWRIRCRLISP